MAKNGAAVLETLIEGYALSKKKSYSNCPSASVLKSSVLYKLSSWIHPGHKVTRQPSMTEMTQQGKFLQNEKWHTIAFILKLPHE
jgi:hypothetical protein